MVKFTVFLTSARHLLTAGLQTFIFLSFQSPPLYPISPCFHLNHKTAGVGQVFHQTFCSKEFRILLQEFPLVVSDGEMHISLLKEALFATFMLK